MWEISKKTAVHCIGHCSTLTIVHMSDNMMFLERYWEFEKVSTTVKFLNQTSKKHKKWPMYTNSSSRLFTHVHINCNTCIWDSNRKLRFLCFPVLMVVSDFDNYDAHSYSLLTCGKNLHKMCSRSSVRHLCYGINKFVLCIEKGSLE